MPTAAYSYPNIYYSFSDNDQPLQLETYAHSTETPVRKVSVLEQSWIPPPAQTENLETLHQKLCALNNFEIRNRCQLAVAATFFRDFETVAFWLCNHLGGVS